MAAIQQWWLGLNRQRPIPVAPTSPWAIEGLADHGDVLFYDSFNTPGPITGQNAIIPAVPWIDTGIFEQTVIAGALRVTENTYSQVTMSQAVPACGEITVVFGTTGLAGDTAPQINFTLGGTSFDLGILGGDDPGTTQAFLQLGGDQYFMTPVSEGPFSIRVRLYQVPTVDDEQVDLWVNEVFIGSAVIVGGLPNTLFDGSGNLSQVTLASATAPETVDVSYAIIGCTGDYVEPPAPGSVLISFGNASAAYLADYIAAYPSAEMFVTSGPAIEDAGTGVTYENGFIAGTGEVDVPLDVTACARSPLMDLSAEPDFKVCEVTITSLAGRVMWLAWHGAGSGAPLDLNGNSEASGANSYYRSDGQAHNYGSGDTFIGTFVEGDIIGLILDPTGGNQVHWFRNGVELGTSSLGNNIGYIVVGFQD